MALESSDFEFLLWNWIIIECSRSTLTYYRHYYFFFFFTLTDDDILNLIKILNTALCAVTLIVVFCSPYRGQSSNGWNDQQRDYLQRRPDGDVLQSGSSFRPSESTPLHYNGHSGIGASTDNGFLYRSPSTIIGSSTTPMPSTNNS